MSKDRGSYLLLEAERAEELSDLVCREIAEGYLPLGSPGVFRFEDENGYPSTVWHQAMTLKGFNR